MRPLTPSQILVAKRMSEAEVEENVRLTCKLFGALYYHTHRSQHSPAGWPDDVILGPGGILYRENKSESGKVSAEQQKWIDGLARHGCDVDVWRPTDWLSGRIEDEIRAVSGRRS